jgi:hypothetical protein
VELGKVNQVTSLRGDMDRLDDAILRACVYTYDSHDEADVRRIRQVLRELGFAGKLPYKTDQETLDGRYSHKGDRHISKYYE